MKDTNTDTISGQHGQNLQPQSATVMPGRRKFFKLVGSGLAVAFIFPDLVSVAGNSSSPNATLPASQVGAWIHIGEDGSITAYTGKVEVGQNIRTSLSQIVAEELRVPLSSVKMVMGDTDFVPFDAGTFGSRSTPQMGAQLRKAAATAREALLEMAAKNWKTEQKELLADAGKISSLQTGKSVSYGDLTKGQQLLMQVSDAAPVTPAADWKLAGRTALKVNGRSFISGKHQYVSDMKLPGMLYGKVLRPPAYRSKLTSADLAAAQAMPGVSVVREGDFIAVAAPTPRQAEKALQAVKVSWESGGSHPKRGDIFDYLVKNASAGSGRNAGNLKGEVEAALSSADYQHKATYHINYIAHVPLEPRAALAEWKDRRLTVWTGTQRPFGVQEDLAEFFKLSKDKVRVIMPDTGSAYGGKHSGEAALEAARLSLKTGKPVKLVWTRKEEFTWAYFRPAGVIEVSSGMKKDGTITGWKFNNYNSGPAAIDTQYDIPNLQIAYHPSESPLAQGSYRGLASTANVFARECQVADLARLAKMDQLQFRLQNLTDDRLKAVLEAAARAFHWTNTRQPGHGFGISCGYEKGGYVGTCAEVLVHQDKSVQVLRVVEAFECGAIVNPRHLENQVMGSIVQGLGGALFEAIDFADGKILNASLSTYRVPRFSDIPKIEIVLLDRKDLPSAGAGEAAIIGVAPAIRNAILDATGIALTALPLIPNGTLGVKNA